jgi:hypothetical protein
MFFIFFFAYLKFSKMYQYVIMSSQIIIFLALTWTKFIFMAKVVMFLVMEFYKF